MRKKNLKKKILKKLDENFMILDKCVGVSRELTQEASERIKDLMNTPEEKKNQAFNELLDALYGRFEEKIEKQKMRDMN